VLSGVQPREAPKFEPLRVELGTHLKAERRLKERQIEVLRVRRTHITHCGVRELRRAHKDEEEDDCLSELSN
jgi:hypothetical protein